MTFHEYGQGNGDVVVLIHPSLVMWDYFEYVIPLMEDCCHLVIPALPGYDPDDKSNFTSVEQIASDLADWLIARGYGEIAWFKAHLPQTIFRIIEDVGHGGLAVLKPELMASELTRVMRDSFCVEEGASR